MTFLRSVKGSTGSDRMKSDDIRKELNIFAIRDKLNFTDRSRQNYTECQMKDNQNLGDTSGSHKNKLTPRNRVLVEKLS
jgi:hypothetical protein